MTFNTTTMLPQVLRRVIRSRRSLPSILPSPLRHDVARGQWRRFRGDVVVGTRFIGTTNTPTTTDTDTTPSTLIRTIDFDAAAKILGNESQILTIQLQPQQLLRAEAGNMIYMTDHVQMNTTTGSGGITQGMTRLMTGQSFFLTDYTYTGPTGTTGTIALGTSFPSKIVRIPLADYRIGKLICQKGALLCSSHTINVQMEFTKNLTSGFFGGEGFILQVRTIRFDGVFLGPFCGVSLLFRNQSSQCYYCVCVYDVV